MKWQMAIAIALMFVAGSANAQSPAGQQPLPVAGKTGAVGASAAAAGGLTQGMISVAVALLAVGVAASASGSSNQTTATTNK